jgi:diguanylate cyclase (GGDEF)-like protein
MADQAPASPGARLRGFWIPAADFYAIADLDTAKRLGGILWLFGTGLALILFPLAHPTRHVGNAGWAMAAGFTVAGIALGALLLRVPDRFTPDALMAMSYAAVAEIALFQWLGGRDSPYAELLLIWAIYTAAAHPPRRVAVYLGIVVAVVLAPLAYEGWNSSVAATAAVRIPLLLGLSSAAMIFTATVRSKRVALHQQGHEASRLARADSLTALGNRRALDEVLERATTGARSSDRPLSVLLADLEGFKSINDRHGHLEGDRCLREVASALRTAVRTPDSCFRWGGDEFVLLLTATDTDGARAVGERLRRTVADTVKLPGGEPLGLSWGVAELRDGMDAAGLVAAADKALLAAKAGEQRAATP